MTDWFSFKSKKSTVIVSVSHKTPRQIFYLILKCKFFKSLNNSFQSEDEEETVQQIDGSQQRFVAHVPVPSQQDIEQALLRRRKQELMEKYGVQEDPVS